MEEKYNGSPHEVPLLLHVNVDIDQPVLVNSQHAFIGHQYHKWKKNTMGLLKRKSGFLDVIIKDVDQHVH